jgi:uncharacterized protein
VVKPGDIVKVKVLDVDIPRKRISLTLRLDDEAAAQDRAPGERRPQRGGGRPPQQRQGGRSGGGRQAAAPAPAGGAMADALRRAGLLDPKKGGRG